MNKHVPVLLKETIQELEILKAQNKKPLYAIDCTLGQAGHSKEIFSKLEKGVLISIDLDINSINWVATACDLKESVYNEKSIYECTEKEKSWRVIQSDFANISEVMDLFEIPKFDFILADLGFSNFQLDKNLGISFDRPYQQLDMRYEESESSHTAAYILNTFDRKDLERLFIEYGQIDTPEMLVTEIVSNRKNNPFIKVGDFVRILQKSKFPKNYKVKAFQALRVYVNKEYERLRAFLFQLPDLLSDQGKALVISFNSLEEQIITKESFAKMDMTTKAPNITEIISNPQSRSAKLHILTKKKEYKDSV